MKNRMLIVIGGLLAALLVVGVVGATSVYAQETPNVTYHGRGPGGGRGLDAQSLEAVAEVLGMTTDDVTSALQDGQTLQDLADEAGVDIADVQAAIQAVHVAEARERIAQAVEDGTMTQAQADWMLEGLDNGYVMGGGPGGFGRGFGGPREGGLGNGFGECPMGVPQTQNGQ